MHYLKPLHKELVHGKTNGRAANHPYFSVFSRKITPLSALRKVIRVVRKFKDCQVTRQTASARVRGQGPGTLACHAPPAATGYYIYLAPTYSTYIVANQAWALKFVRIVQHILLHTASYIQYNTTLSYLTTTCTLHCTCTHMRSTRTSKFHVLIWEVLVTSYLLDVVGGANFVLCMWSVSPECQFENGTAGKEKEKCLLSFDVDTTSWHYSQ